MKSLLFALLLLLCLTTHAQSPELIADETWAVRGYCCMGKTTIEVHCYNDEIYKKIIKDFGYYALQVHTGRNHYHMIAFPYSMRYKITTKIGNY